MNTKAAIKKTLIILFWICIGGGMLTLLIAAIGKKNKEICSDYSISVKSNQEKNPEGCCIFLDEKDISGLLMAALGTEIKGKKVNEINLDQMEQLLEDNIWVSDAEMWFDNRNVLRVSVTERDPVARIFTTDGNSFYIDSNLVRLPLSEKVSVRLPVFSSFPSGDLLTPINSLLLEDVKNIATCILRDSFLMSQVSQVDIVKNENPVTVGYEIIPVVGNHLVKLGDGKNLEKKFNRLMIFYKQVLSKSGFNTYSVVDVQYAGQVIGTKPGKEKTSVDFVKLRMNVDRLLNKVQKMQADSAAALKPEIEKPGIKEKQQQKSGTNLTITGTPNGDPNTVKTVSLPKEEENKSEEKKPKAVMPKKNRE